tara:strand:- start:5378 stop:6124 length:747 start_codon:yes stop_codon:yes gene_type:complete
MPSFNYLTLKGALESFVFGPGIFWFLLAWVLIVRKKFTSQKEALASRIGLAGLILILSMTFPPLYEIASYPFSLSELPNSHSNAGAVVVLGGGVDKEGRPSYSSMKRVYWGGELILNGKAPLLILTSGRTNSNTDSSEAYGMSLIAKAMGVPEAKIVLEEESYNTLTNAKNTKELLNKHNIKSIILVTSYSHLYRAYKTFDKQGINVISVVGENEIKLSSFGWGRAVEMQGVLHEYMAIMLYKIKGWI